MLEKEALDDVGVHKRGAIVLDRRHEPRQQPELVDKSLINVFFKKKKKSPSTTQRKIEKERNLEGVVKGEPEEENVGKVLEEGKGGKGAPVNEPLCVVILVGRLNGLEAAEDGVRHADHGRDDAHAIKQQRKEHKTKQRACQRPNIMSQTRR